MDGSCNLEINSENFKTKVVINELMEMASPYLTAGYGEKVKAYLRKGARPLRGIETYPDARVGWGAVCVSESLPE